MHSIKIDSIKIEVMRCSRWKVSQLSIKWELTSTHSLCPSTQTKRTDLADVSARISQHTSLSLIFSITFTGYVDYMRDDGEHLLDVEYPWIPEDWTPLALPVLAICVPPNQEAYLTDPYSMSAFNPTTLIAQGPLRTTSNPAPDVGYWSLIEIPPMLAQGPSTVIQSEVIFDDLNFSGQNREDQPVRFFVDFLGSTVTEENNQLMTVSGTAADIVADMTPESLGIIPGLPDPQYRVEIWVDDAKTRDETVERLDSHGRDNASKCSVNVASDRVRRFRAGMVQGVKKWMDWEAVEVKVGPPGGRVEWEDTRGNQRCEPQ